MNLKKHFAFLLSAFLLLAATTTNAQIQVTLGTGTLVNGTTGYPAPYGNYYWGAKHQFVIPAAEITAAGGFAGLIQSLAFDVATVEGVPLTGFTISLGTTTQPTLSAFVTTGMTQVFAPTTYTEIVGWNTHTFATPFFWNGTDNLVVETCFNNASYTNNAIVNQTDVGYNAWVHYKADNTTTVCSDLTVSSIFANATWRPNMRFSFLPNVGTDAAAVQLLSPVAPILGGSSQSISFKIGNFAASTINTATVGYKLGNNPAVTTSASGLNLLLGQTTNYAFATPATMPPSGSAVLKVWIKNPNGVNPDLNPNNDTLTTTIVTAMPAGTYTVGGSNPDFPTITAAINAMKQGGILGNVLFNIRNGRYVGSYDLDNIIAPSGATISFASEMGSASGVVLVPSGTTAATASTFIFKVNNTANVAFTGLTFKRTIDNLSINYNLWLNNSNGTNVTNCAFQDSLLGSNTKYGIYAIGCSSTSVVLNTFDGFYYGVYLQSASPAMGLGNLVQINTFNNYQISAIYLSRQELCTAKGNTINSARTASGFGYAIYSLVSSSLNISDNKISGNIPAYGIYIENFNAGLVPNIISNNAISGKSEYQFTSYGLYLEAFSSATTTPRDTIDYADVYHNTINIEANSAGGTHYGLYIEGSTATTTYLQGLKFKNNNIVVKRGPSGTSATSRVGYIFNANILPLIQSNYNNYVFVNNTANSPLFGTQTPAATYVDIAALRAVFVGQEINSASIDPGFSGVSAVPSSSVFDNKGTNVGISTDINGAARSTTTPDIGAYEFSPSTSDAGIISMTAPNSDCGLANNETVTVKVKNFGSSPITSIALKYSINSGAFVSQTFAQTINSGDTATFSFATRANLSVPATYNLKCISNLTGDTNLINDTISKSVTNIPVISTFPYTQNFEADNGGFITDGINNSWAWGTPAKTVINSAGGGAKCWVTNLTGKYNVSELSFIQFPCLNTTGIPTLKFKAKVWWNTERNWDGAALQYSLNGGTSWTSIGVSGDPNNWYNANTMTSASVRAFFDQNQNWWSGRASTTNGSGGWVTIERELPAACVGVPNLLLRIAFGSDTSAEDDGFAIDDISITSALAPKITSVTRLSNGCSLVARPVRAKIISVAALTNVTLQYNTLANPTFQNVAMTLNAADTTWRASIPAPTTRNTTVNYRVIALDASALGDTSSIRSYTDAYLTVVDIPVDSLAIGLGGTANLTVTNPVTGKLLITEVFVNRGGTGTQTTFPAYSGSTANNDFIELTNLSALSTNISGDSIVLYVTTIGTTATKKVFPPNTILAGGGRLLLNPGSGTDNPTNQMYYMGGTSNDFVSSGSNLGVVYKRGTTILDAVAKNTFIFGASTGVVAADWSGTQLSSSGLAGIIRYGAADNNTSADWKNTAVGADTSSIGYKNPQITIPVLGYTWVNKNTGTVVGTGPSVSVSPTVRTVYRVTLTDGVCNTSDSVIVRVTTGIGEQNGKNSLISKIYPNPSSDFINIDFSSTINKGSIELVDMFGRVVMLVAISEQNQVRLNVETLAQGVYSFRIQSGDKSQYGQVVITR